MSNSLFEENLKVDGCKVHGNCNAADEMIELKEERIFTQYMCFLATLKFKLYHVYETPEVSHSHRQNKCKDYLNILFLFLEYGKPGYYLYPLRALAELFSS